MGEHRGRLAGLDGLRGVAVTLVVVGHTWNETLGRAAPAGVTLFFALSGYLITRLLLERPTLRTFWLRRAARLLPSLALMLVVTGVVWLSLDLDYWSQMWPGALYVADFTTHDDRGPFAHLWSLSVEEQWYAVWPLLMLWRPRLVAVVIVVVSLTRLAVFGYDTLPVANMWPLAAGALLALTGWTPQRSALDWRPLVWLGSISYALYLWHYPLIYLADKWVTSPGTLAPVAAGFAIPVAWASTRFIEEPVRRAARRSDRDAVVRAEVGVDGGQLRTGQDRVGF